MILIWKEIFIILLDFFQIDVFIQFSLQILHRNIFEYVMSIRIGQQKSYLVTPLVLDEDPDKCAKLLPMR